LPIWRTLGSSSRVMVAKTMRRPLSHKLSRGHRTSDNRPNRDKRCFWPKRHWGFSLRTLTDATVASVQRFTHAPLPPRFIFDHG
jgi:hypothetical protein